MAEKQKRQTIGVNPLDLVIPQAARTETPEPRTSSTAPQPEKAAKERLTVHVSTGLIDRVKNAVYWTPGLTLAGLAEQAFSKILEDLEQDRGGPFPQRREELKGGRPLK